MMKENVPATMAILLQRDRFVFLILNLFVIILPQRMLKGYHKVPRRNFFKTSSMVNNIIVLLFLFRLLNVFH